jgi:hypothetical protein
METQKSIAPQISTVRKGVRRLCNFIESRVQEDLKGLKGVRCLPSDAPTSDRALPARPAWRPPAHYDGRAPRVESAPSWLTLSRSA